MLIYFKKSSKYLNAQKYRMQVTHHSLRTTGQGAPPIPKSDIEIPEPPLKIQTARETYYIQLLWDPQTIQVGKKLEECILNLA
jgi:hypothetical protein